MSTSIQMVSARGSTLVGCGSKGLFQRNPETGEEVETKGSFADCVAFDDAVFAILKIPRNPARGELVTLAPGFSEIRSQRLPAVKGWIGRIAGTQFMDGTKKLVWATDNLVSLFRVESGELVPERTADVGVRVMDIALSESSIFILSAVSGGSRLTCWEPDFSMVRWEVVFSRYARKLVAGDYSLLVIGGVVPNPRGGVIGEAAVYSADSGHVTHNILGYHQSGDFAGQFLLMARPDYDAGVGLLDIFDLRDGNPDPDPKKTILLNFTPLDLRVLDDGGVLYGTGQGLFQVPADALELPETDSTHASEDFYDVAERLIQDGSVRLSDAGRGVFDSLVSMLGGTIPDRESVDLLLKLAQKFG